MFAGGSESCICPTGVAGFTALTALTTTEDPLRASIPFDKERSGFVLGEGAGIVVLEELEHAKARGARIYAEVIGYAVLPMHFISLLRRKMEAAPKRQCSLRWRRQELRRKRWIISMHMEQAPTTMTCLKQGQ